MHDDLVLSAGSRKEVLHKFGDWKTSLDVRVMKVSIVKTKLMMTIKRNK